MKTVSVDFYAIVNQRFSNYGTQVGRASIRVTKSKPDCSSTEVAVRISLKLPENLFVRPTLQAKIVVPEGQSQFEITPDVEEGIARVVQEQLGITMRVTAGDSQP